MGTEDFEPFGERLFSIQNTRSYGSKL